MRHICVLGSTGSIGVNTLEVVRLHPELFKIEALTAHTNVKLLAQQCIEFSPAYAVLGDEEKVEELKTLLVKANCKTEVAFGPEALVTAATLHSVDTVMAAIVGAAGLVPTIEAAHHGKRILLANKEALVMAGALFMNTVSRSGAELLPIDSEHNAIYQCLPDANASNAMYRGQYAKKGVKEILLTASGGPFRNKPIHEFDLITPDQACAHPNWVMGRKISVDSATMMNKGLEVIEAHYLFGLAAEQIKVLIHPQSVIHSMVRYLDGSVIAQLGQPDMKTPIAYGLAWPSRVDGGVKELDFLALNELHFEPVDHLRFPCLNLAYQALQSGGLAPTVLNAANEIAVEAFLNQHIKFTQIPEVVEEVLTQCGAQTSVLVDESLECILEADAMARTHSKQVIKDRSL
jgi:1-deoxy-D-xylulose-5-phosphate reductoisomerase